MELNIRRNIFVSEYVKNGNVTEAAIKAGYSKKTAYSQGSRLLKKVEIQEQIKEQQERIEQAARVDPAYIISSLREIAERCMQRVPVMVFNKEEKTYEQKVDPDTGEGIWVFDSAGANRALELLGKTKALFTDVSKNEGSAQTVVVMPTFKSQGKTVRFNIGDESNVAN